MSKKDELLAKSRNERNDEYEVKTLKDSQTFGIFIITAVCVFFMIANAVISDIKGLEKGIVSFDYAAILFACVSGIWFYNFKKTQKATMLAAGIVSALAFTCMAILYFINI
jgi:hypothetical protein